MQYEEAMQGHAVTERQALRELANHGFEAVIQDGALFGLMEFSRGDHPARICAQWERVNMDSRSIVEWLGY